MMFGPKLQQNQYLTSVNFVEFQQDQQQSEEYQLYEGSKVELNIESPTQNENQPQQIDIQKNQNETIQQQQQEVIKVKEIIPEPPKPKTPQELKIEKYQKLADQALENCKKFSDISKWTEVENKKGIRGFKREQDEGQVETMGLGTINKSDLKYVQWYFENNENPKVSKNLSPMQVESILIEKLNDNLKLVYSESSPPMATNRYSKLVCANIKEGDNYYYIAISSDFPEDAKLKNLSKIIESKLLYNGFLLTPSKENQNEYQIQMVSNFSIGGSLPGFILKKVRNNRGFDQIKLMKDFIAMKIKEENKKK